MPHDAKLGLVLGLGLTLAVAISFYGHGAGPSHSALRSEGAAVAKSAAVPDEVETRQPPVTGTQVRLEAGDVDSHANSAPPSRTPTPPPPPASLRPMAPDRQEWRPMPRQHVVTAGDTLFSLAEHYYGNRQRFVDIFKANANVLADPERLSPGTTLTIP